MTPRSAPAWLVVTAVLGAACGNATHFTPSSVRYPPREKDCEFEVFTIPPKSGWIEIGKIDDDPQLHGFNFQSTSAKFKDTIRPSVCRGGGEGAVLLNANGLYTGAIVLRRVTGAATDECGVDTDCAGELVCVKRACVDRSPR